jgi:hypothetical protein
LPAGGGRAELHHLRTRCGLLVAAGHRHSRPVGSPPLLSRFPWKKAMASGRTLRSVRLKRDQRQATAG